MMLLSINFQSVNIGCWEMEPDVLPLPTSPVYSTGPGGVGGATGGGSGGDTPELILEYWSTKGQKEKVCGVVFM